MDEISETQAALRETMENEKQRLVNASQQREFLRKQLEVGVTPNHYRIDWLRGSSQAVIETLARCASIFNRAYPLDKITAADLIDVINTTHAKILARLQSAEES